MIDKGKTEKTERLSRVEMKCDRCDRNSGTLVRVGDVYRHADHIPVIKPPAVKVKGWKKRKPLKMHVTRNPETGGRRRHSKAGA